MSELAGVIFVILAIISLMALTICVYIWIKATGAEPRDTYAPYLEMIELKEKKEDMGCFSMILLLCILLFLCIALALLK